MGRAPCCEKVGLKRGRWTAEEDQLLVNYIKANGEGSWRSLPKNAGLLRCGKSCRLRWINYLREDLKRGNISPEEEDTIIKLQATLGNRWSLIAGHLPGRTDNEIKNYWNSHLSKKAQGLLDADESDGSAAPAATTGKRKRNRGGGSGQVPTIKKKKKKSSSSSNNLDGEIKEDPATKKQQQKKSLLPVGATTGPSKAIVSTTVAEDDPLQTTGEGSQGVDGTDLLRELEEEEEEEVTVEDGSVMVHSSMCLIMGATTKQIKEVAGSEGSHEEGDGRATSSITEEREAGAASVATSLSSEGTSSEKRADVGVDGNACGDDGAAKGQEEESFNFEGFENLPWEDVGDIWNCLWDGGQELDMQSTLGFHLCEDNFENWLFSDIL